MSKPVIFDCLSCPAFKATANDQPQQGGTCRQHPPVPYLVGSDKFNRPTVLSVWPTVGKGDYCFHHPYLQETMAARSIPMMGITPGGAPTALADALVRAKQEGHTVVETAAPKQ